MTHIIMLLTSLISALSTLMATTLITIPIFISTLHLTSLLKLNPTKFIMLMSIILISALSFTLFSWLPPFEILIGGSGEEFDLLK